MNEMPNVPAPMSEPAAPRSLFQTWIDAVTKPNERTFAAIASSPNASTTNAIIWVAIGSVISSFLSLLAPNTGLQDVRRILEQQGINDQFLNSLGTGGGGLGAKIFQFVCGVPIAATFAIVGFLIGVALIQWVARMFGGRGTFEKLAYTFAAVAAPMSIVSGLLALLGAIPLVGLCFGLLGVAAVIYAVVLEIMATKAVHGFGWGQATGSVLIPGAVIFLLCCCLLIGLFTLAGVALGNVFSQIGPLPFPTP